MKELYSEFQIHKLGLDIRLVNESDAGFILSLRTNNRLNKFLHQTEDDIEKQTEWIKEYKKREREGREYYFVYLKDGVKVGVNRIYNVYAYYGTIGSWICKPDNDPEISIATYILMFDLLFDYLMLEIAIFEVQLGNRQVIKLHKMLGVQEVGKTEEYVFFTLNKKAYRDNRNKLVSIFNLK